MLVRGNFEISFLVENIEIGGDLELLDDEWLWVGSSKGELSVDSGLDLGEDGDHRLGQVGRGGPEPVLVSHPVNDVGQGVGPDILVRAPHDDDLVTVVHGLHDAGGLLADAVVGLESVVPLVKVVHLGPGGVVHRPEYIKGSP